MRLRVGEGEVASHQQQNANYGHLSQLARVVTDLSSTQATKCQHEDAGNEEADAAHERRRNLLDRNVDGQIGGSPEKIDQTEGQDHGEALLALSLSHGG